jgi:hypothetical protein
MDKLVIKQGSFIQQTQYFIPDSRSGGNQCFSGPNWFLPDLSIGPACLRISENDNNMADKKIEIITLHWINSMIRNNQCILTTQNGGMNKKIVQQIIPYSHTPMFHDCTITNVNITINKTLSLENFQRHGATSRFCLHVVNI